MNNDNGKEREDNPRETDTENTEGKLKEEVETDNSLDFGDFVKARVDEAIKPILENIEDLTTKYNELSETVKKKRTIINFNNIKKESPEELIKKNINKTHDFVIKTIT